MPIKKIISVCCFALLLFSTAGCGFKLRGQETLPPQLHIVFLETHDPYGALAKLLHQTLLSAGILLTPTPAQAPLSLEIISDVFSQQISSISASTKVIQQLLFYRVSYLVRDNHGVVIIPPSFVVVTRTYTANLAQMLGGTIEQNLLKEDMRREAIQQLLNQLSSMNTVRALSKMPPP